MTIVKANQTVVTYCADDGTTFNSEADCLKYENAAFNKRYREKVLASNRLVELTEAMDRVCYTGDTLFACRLTSDSDVLAVAGALTTLGETDDAVGFVKGLEGEMKYHAVGYPCGVLITFINGGYGYDFDFNRIDSLIAGAKNLAAELEKIAGLKEDSLS